MSALAAPAVVSEQAPRPPAAAPDAEAQREAREQARREAGAWLAALPSRTVIRRCDRATPAPPRLVMYRAGASTPRFWEATWRVSPSYRMRGYTLPRWYAAILTRRLPRDGLMVEAGCGNGNLLRMLVNHDPARWGNFSLAAGGGAGIEGLDFAADAIAENRRIHPEGRYRVGDVRELPYGDGELSAYISMGVIEHFTDDQRRRIIAEAARCLRPGGVAVITVPELTRARRIRTMLGAFPDEHAPPSGERTPPNAEFYQFYFTLGEIRAELEAAGLRVIETDGYDCRRGLGELLGVRGDRMLGRIEKRSKRLSRWLEQPPRMMRRFCPHMLMLVAEKTAPASTRP